MKSKYFLILPVLAAMFYGAYFIILEPEAEKIISPVRKIQKPEDIKSHQAASFNREFYGDMENARPLKVLEGPVYGGIVSHHLAASRKIAEYFAGLKNIRPKTVVIIGPNHFNAGADILVSGYNYETPWGNIGSDHEIVGKIIEAGAAENNEQPFEKEHSVSALVSYVKYNFPGAKIVPVIIKRNVAQKKLDRLADELNEILPAESLVLASVDFSHHGNSIVADYHDTKSISAIENFDLKNIFKLEIDSPASLYVLLKYLRFRGVEKMTYTNTDSAVIGDDPASQDVTSYVFGYFQTGGNKKESEISLLSFGDVMLDREVRRRIAGGGDPFSLIRGTDGNFFRGVDFTNINLEGPITDNLNCPRGELSFGFDPITTVKFLKENNINLANLANNHTANCGKTGIRDTAEYLSGADIGYFGSADTRFAVKQIGNAKIAFVGINALEEGGRMSGFYALIKKLKSENDHVVVNIHWGNEYSGQFSVSQQNIAHKLIDSGADMIIGHHPHVVQPMEVYKNKPIFYSLGNFVFDQVFPETKKGLGVGAIFSKDKISLSLFPFEIKNYFQPVLLDYDGTKAFCGEFLKDLPQTGMCKIEISQQ